jgi:hypothetical protein
MNKRLAVIAVLVAAVAAAGLFASPSNSAQKRPNCDPPYGCPVYLTATGPSPATLTENALQSARFYNADSVSHSVVFANGLCSLTVAPDLVNRDQGVDCANGFMPYVGSYAYTVDGKFSGTVVTTPLRRSVTLTARTHAPRGGTRLILRGRVMRSEVGGSPPAPVVVFVRHDSKQPFKPIATIRTRFDGPDDTAYGWKLTVRPGVTTTYIARVRGQRLCYFPAARCGRPHGQVWANATSRPFTIRIRH